MNLKTKSILGFLVALLLLLSTGFYARYSLRQLAGLAPKLRADFHSVQLGQQLYAVLDQLAPAHQHLFLTGSGGAATAERPVQQGLQLFAQCLPPRTRGLAAPGERQVTDSLIRAFDAYQRLLAPGPLAPRTSAYYFAHVLPQHQLLRAQTRRLVQLRMAALTRQHAAAARTATHLWRNSLLLALGELAALGLVLGVLWAVASSLRKLLASIAQASEPNARVRVVGHDELSQVARAVNMLLDQLHAYRTSTLAQLTAERNRMRSILDTLDEGLLVVDENHRILVANPVISRLLNVSIDQLVGQSAGELAQQSTLFKNLLASLEKPADQRARQTITLPQVGENVYYELQINDVVSFDAAMQKEELIGSVLTLRDISEYRRLDQSKWRFLTTVAQELQTPLAGMQLSLQRLQDGKSGPLTAEQQNITYTLTRENKHLLKLVHELQDVSRLELGTIQLTFQSARLHEIVQFAADTIRPQLQPKRLVLNLQVADTLPLVRADIEKTTWVLLSLLANAIRYAHLQDQLHVRASLLPNGQQVQVSVQDQGPGIDPAMHEKIFQRFTQLPSQSGTGLGLSIAREFISSQGGQLWVESALGAGSTFVFTLPVSLAPVGRLEATAGAGGRE